MTVDDGHFYEQSSGDELTLSQHQVQNQKFKSISLVRNYYRDERRQQKIFKQSLEKAAATAAKRPMRSGTPGLVAGPSSAVQNIFNMPASSKRMG